MNKPKPSLFEQKRDKASKAYFESVLYTEEELVADLIKYEKRMTNDKETKASKEA